MVRRKLLALLVAATVFCIAGAVHSDSPVSGNVTLMDFEDTTNTLLGYPDGTPPLGWFKRVPKTKYVPAFVDPKYPPNPCRAWTRLWNRVLTHPKLPAYTRQVLLTVVLRKLAQHQCRADIDRDANSDPQTILSIQPTP